MNCVGILCFEHTPPKSTRWHCLQALDIASTSVTKDNVLVEGAVCDIKVPNPNAKCLKMSVINAHDHKGFHWYAEVFSPVPKPLHLVSPPNNTILDSHHTSNAPKQGHWQDMATGVCSKDGAIHSVSHIIIHL